MATEVRKIRTVGPWCSRPLATRSTQNPNGGQIFAIQPDGTGLRQLTDSRGLVKEADGTYSGELPGPWAYGPYVP